MNCSINRGASKVSFLLTIFGMDGYFFYKINDFYILGEWFLGCIILLYLCFPILRILLLKYPKRLFTFVILLYFFVVHRYIFRMEIDRNILTRLPEFVIGMYFAQYIKKLNLFNGRLISNTETLCLFILVCIVIAIITHLLYKLYNFLGINAKKLILD